MTLRKTLIMALILVLGLLCFWKYEQEHPEPPDNGESGEITKLIQELSEDKITEFSVVHAKGSYALLGKQQSEGEDENLQWLMKRPEGALADQKVVQEILSAIGDLEIRNTILPKEVEDNQGLYGLVPPELILSVKQGNKKHVLSFGKKHPLSARRYVQREKDTHLYLVDDHPFSVLARHRDEVRDRQPLKFKAEDVNSLVVVRQGKEPLVFKKSVEQGAGIPRWSIKVKGRDVEADKDLLEMELVEFAQSRVKRFVDEPGPTLALYGLVHPEVIFKLSVNDRRDGDSTARQSGVRDILVQVGRGVGLDTDPAGHSPGRAKISYYFKISGEPWIYEFEKFFSGDWLQPAEHFRDKTPFDTLSDSDIEQVLIRKGPNLEEEFSLVRKSREIDSEWDIILKEGGDGTRKQIALKQQVEDWLGQLFRLRTLSYPALKGDPEKVYGLDKPELDIVLHLRESKEQMKLMIAGAVKSAGTNSDDQESEGEKLEEPAILSPRFALVVGKDGDGVVAVLSGASATELDKPSSYFTTETK